MYLWVLLFLVLKEFSAVDLVDSCKFINPEWSSQSPSREPRALAGFLFLRLGAAYRVKEASAPQSTHFAQLSSPELRAGHSRGHPLLLKAFTLTYLS